MHKKLGAYKINKRAVTHSFRLRIGLLVMISVVGISIFVTFFAAGIVGTSIVDNAKSLTIKQEESIASSLGQEIASIYQLGQLTKTNSILLEDLTHDRHEVDNYAVLANKVYMEMLNTRKLKESVAQVSILKYLDKSVKYIGAPWISPPKAVELYDQILEDYRSDGGSEYREMTMKMGGNLFHPATYSLNLYFPIYDPLKVYMEIGLLCISVDESALSDYYREGLFENTFLADENGIIVSNGDKNQIGTKYPLDFMQDEPTGIYSNSGKYIIWNHIGICNWYVIVSTSLYAIVSQSIWPLAIMLGFVILFCFGASLLCYRIMNGLVRPLQDLKDRMNSVAAGDMAIRMDVEYIEDEFNDMAQSFNKMVKDVDNLMLRIKEEQNQMKQIELGALQSQIKPHFLYNSLECIHWQSLMDGNTKVSTLVLALANYYRLCLSKGQDIVTLEQEFSHIQSYLVIQNVRYKDIIRCEISVDDDLLNTPIPKMTLQPLVENSIYHGIKVKEGFCGVISISAYLEGGKVSILVCDNGVGMSEEQVDELNQTISIFDDRYGYGVRNVNRRLEILFGAEYGLRYLHCPQGGCKTQILLPALKEAE